MAKVIATYSIDHDVLVKFNKKFPSSKRSAKVEEMMKQAIKKPTKKRK